MVVLPRKKLNDWTIQRRSSGGMKNPVIKRSRIKKGITKLWLSIRLSLMMPAKKLSYSWSPFARKRVVAVMVWLKTVMTRMPCVRMYM